jgi:hypothetical protein
MSDFHAIGGVSATLQTLLRDRMELPDGIVNVPVTIGPPPFAAIDANPHREDPRVNLFCYRVTENGFLQNQEIPGRGGSGYGHPPLSLNLHYLVTAYGNVELPTVPPSFDDTNAQYLLGSAMRVLHDVPVVTQALRTLQPPSGAIVLHESLRDEFEQLKTTLEPLTLEDVTKVWTALALRMRLAAAYVVNVAQIESRRPRRFPRPVGQPASATVPPPPGDLSAPGPIVTVLTIQTPTVTDLAVRRAGTTVEQPFAYARVLDTLVLRGTSLAGPVTSLAFGDVVVRASVALADRVEVVVPDAVVPGVGPIPPELQLQPGVRTARVVVRDPLVPQRAFGSNEVPFMLVPAVSPLAVVYGAGPPRTLTLSGTRLVAGASGGETMIGRSAVARADYLTATPTLVVVPIPDTLPTRNVHALVGGPLAPMVPLGPGAQTLDITIGATTHSRTANLASPVARDALAPILASLIHDAAPTDPRFGGARVDLWHDRLIVVPGGLTDAISIVSPGGLPFAGDLGLQAPQPPGATAALVSGELGSPPPISSPFPRVRLTIGAQPPIDVPVTAPTSLADLADDLQATINAIGGAPEYVNARVALTGRQLLVIPGLPGTVTFDPAPTDDTTVVELQLHARFAVRVRVAGAESIDPAVVELPQ